MQLKGNNVLLCISGSIAAYKSVFLVRLLIKAGANVKVILTQAAQNFVTPLTLSTLSKNPAYTDYFNTQTGEWNSHVDFGLWADLMLIAPATAHTISKMASGAADNLLLATYLSARCPVFFAPAMDLDMFQHPATKKNINILTNFGNILIKPEKGELASGLSGEGRMAEPENIVNFLSGYQNKSLPLSGKKIMITAGPTIEEIDPVRFISNHSSGKMGYALANTAKKLGAEVTLISGPTALEKPQGVNLISVKSAEEMFVACKKNFTQNDILIKAAAVADYSPEKRNDKKIKKTADATEACPNSIGIKLSKTKDILTYLGENKTRKQFLVGFALETDNAEKNAKEKLQKKHLDMIVLNSLQDKGAGFGFDTNKVTIFDKYNNCTKFELKSKDEISREIWNYIIKQIGV